MIETHTRILGIAPYDGMRTAMEQAAQAYPNVEMDKMCIRDRMTAAFAGPPTVLSLSFMPPSIRTPPPPQLEKKVPKTRK